METAVTTIKGLAADVIISETTHRDTRGILFYLATIVIRSHKTGVEKIARRSRIPGTGKSLAREVQRMGIRRPRQVERLIFYQSVKYFSKRIRETFDKDSRIGGKDSLLFESFRELLRQGFGALAGRARVRRLRCY